MKNEMKLKKGCYLYFLLMFLFTILNVIFSICSMKIIAGLFAVGVIGGVLLYLLNEDIDIENRIVLLLLVIITIIACIPNFSQYIYRSMDLNFHLNRICAVAEELKNHQFPVRMQTTTLNNYGYATSLFYSDLFIYVPAVLYLFGVPLHACYNLYIIMCTILLVLASYISFKKIFNSKKMGLIGCALYSLSIYRLINVFVRAAVGEFTAMIFLPVLVWGAWNFLKKEGKFELKDYLPFVIGITGLLQSHILSCEMVAEFGILLILCNIKSLFKKEKLIALFKTILWCIGLNLFFLVPFIMSSGMDLDVFNGTNVIYLESHGLYLLQLFGLFFEYSLGNSDIKTEGEMPLGIGLGLVCALFVFGYFIMNRKKWGIFSENEYKYGKQVCCFTIVAIMMMSNYFPWGLVRSKGGKIGELLMQIQFPWRYLGIATVLLVVLNLCVVSLLQKKGYVFFAKAMGGIAIGLSLISVFYFYCGLGYNGEQIRIQSYEQLGSGNISLGEYMLVGTDMDGLKVKEKPYSDDETLKLSNYHIDKGVKYVSCENGTKESSVVMPAFAYDNYVAYDTETKKEFVIQKSDENLIEVIIPAAFNGNIALKYEEPLIWRCSEIISILTVIGLCSVILFRKREVIMGKKGIQNESGK